MPDSARPSLTLYYSPGACSLAAHIALREAGLPFEARRVLIAEGEHLAPEYLAVNPRGRVPTLVIDGTPVTELSAILGWIADRSPGLAPAPGTLAAAQCAEWLGWFTSGVHISFALIWRGSRFLERNELHAELKAAGLATLRRQLADIEARLTAHDYLVGGDYSVADANALVFYRWAGRVGFDQRGDYPSWTRHAERLLQRPAVRAALAAEGIEIWPSAAP
ncbi:MAG TPA: glutathione S-transferase N-terminal domain-containing protein [Steroidobacteraceae bacterium]|nr:glutathione S-transferase N-terminal domain-containing protein [Steroidobacteraceae bacterium]